MKIWTFVIFIFLGCNCSSDPTNEKRKDEDREAHHEERFKAREAHRQERKDREKRRAEKKELESNQEARREARKDHLDARKEHLEASRERERHLAERKARETAENTRRETMMREEKLKAQLRARDNEEKTRLQDEARKVERKAREAEDNARRERQKRDAEANRRERERYLEAEARRRREADEAATRRERNIIHRERYDGYRRTTPLDIADTAINAVAAAAMEKQAEAQRRQARALETMARAQQQAEIAKRMAALNYDRNRFAILHKEDKERNRNNAILAFFIPTVVGCIFGMLSFEKSVGIPCVVIGVLFGGLFALSWIGRKRLAIVDNVTDRTIFLSNDEDGLQQYDIDAALRALSQY
jgi:hypothetical protein